jgi:tetratricopeptide (TPR) repeat protein
MFGNRGKRPFERIAEAEQAWHAGDLAHAERLFAAGIAAYRKEEPEGLDFAMGRCGAFLLAQGRRDEAASVFEQAIELKTDLPAIWSDYLQIIVDRRDMDSLKRAIARSDVSMKHPIEPELLLAHARRADRDGATGFAEQLARWTIERCVRSGDQEGRWAAIGDLGRIVERAGELDQAVALWRSAFEGGSRDGQTANRLSMHLEHAADYAGAMTVIREALGRGLPANVEETLRKRLLRCEPKLGRGQAQAGKRIDVTAYSIRRGSSLIKPQFQVRLKRPVRQFGIVGNVVRCLLTLNESSTLVDIGLSDGSELRRVEGLPVLSDIRFSADGWAVGICRTGAVGQGRTLLKFLSVEGRLISESSIPDAVSEVSRVNDLWYVGCRDGFLYGFGLDGRQRWSWQTPGAKDSTDNAYFRPCPYYVASHAEFAVVASMGNVYAISSNGRTLWHTRLPNEHETRWQFTIPFPGVKVVQEPYRVLDLSPYAPLEKVKSAYRRLALATHPDRNPDDRDATVKFRRIQEAYERILAGDTRGGTATGGLTVTMGIQGLGPMVTFLSANAAGVVVGSSQGRLYSFDRNGGLRSARVLGDGPVRVAIRPGGALGAAWSTNALFFFKEENVINAAESVEWPHGLTMWGDDVVVWRRNEMEVRNEFGQLRWSVEFSKSVGNALNSGNKLLCTAGVLAVFVRHAGG